MVRGMSITRPTSRSIHAAGPRALLVLIAALAVAACGGTATTTPTPTATTPPAAATPTSAPSATPAPSKGPATAQFSLVGTAGLTGPVTTQEITCGGPTLDGPQIFFLGRSGANGPQVVIFILAAHIEVRVATGSADTLRLRNFVGTGVTSFDAASGARLDSPLTETTDAATATTGIGALTSISGTVDCGNQQAGSSTLIVSGLTTFGQLSGSLTSIHVTCTVTASGTYVGTQGLMTAGSTPVLVFITASTGLLQVAVEIRGSGEFFSSKGSGLVALETNGAQMSGSVEVEQAGATPSPHMVHVAGESICGTTIQQ